MNLDELDREVRESLAAHADDAPSGAGTLDAVRSRSRRILVRQRAGLAGVAALVAVAAAVATPYAFTGTDRHPTAPRVGIGGPTTTHTTTAPATTTKPPAVTVLDRRSRVQLVAGSTALVAFPLNPTFTPAGLAAPTVGRTVGEIRLVYSNPDNTGLVVAVDTTKAFPSFTPTNTKPITVNGHPATLYTAGNNVAIIWKLHSKWVHVDSTGVSVADAERFARGLTEHPMASTGLPFTMALVPQGYVVAFQEIHPELTPTEFYFLMSSPAQVNNQLTKDAVGIVQYAGLEQDAATSNGRPVTVGGYPGKLVTGDQGQVDLFVLRPGFPYLVHEPDNGPLSNADLIRFAAGVAPAA